MNAKAVIKYLSHWLATAACFAPTAQSSVHPFNKVVIVVKLMPLSNKYLFKLGLLISVSEFYNFYLLL
ncbi:hypothetical protein BEL05_08295 [Shewanella colwelliana]|uniref:Uncharacterized protein n=1 Tax=Shewanella colwelliana TaxID=23 RepID=A0A1E5IUS3_SHECO|nr:hypothetical protein BEL05_08295 [Shewanella colwelliana]